MAGDRKALRRRRSPSSAQPGLSQQDRRGLTPLSAIQTAAEVDGDRIRPRRPPSADERVRGARHTKLGDRWRPGGLGPPSRAAETSACSSTPSTVALSRPSWSQAAVAVSSHGLSSRFAEWERYRCRRRGRVWSAFVRRPSPLVHGPSAVCPRGRTVRRPPSAGRTSDGRRRTSCGRTIRRAVDEAGTERDDRWRSINASHARVARCGSSSAASCTRAALASNRRCETGIGSPLEPAVIDRSTSIKISREARVANSLHANSCSVAPVN
ncbi:hypothetical protein SAMN06265355_102431 [Actinomadura mexicana]|uniref:Uncharacterized protein n=1 Tax=Actinomadura mexicana TaxID=134959 RepID=A0A238VVD6_9ACTN|nr:hypothetical protein SAMN06265355_102431 [Actinomadura mexicana]